MERKIVLKDTNGKTIIGIGTQQLLQLFEIRSWKEIDDFIAKNEGKTLFITLSYELRNFILTDSQPTSSPSFPLIQIWQAEQTSIYQNGLLIASEGEIIPENKFQAEQSDQETPIINWKSKQTKEEYCQQVNYLKKHIQLGNMYEVNYCQEFFAENIKIDSIQTIYNQLNTVTQTPFSACLETENWMIACASPERFIQKTGSRIISQPIKGTAPRGKTEQEDNEIKSTLLNSQKERSENHMIVDLVRNDLSKVATKGSVKVDELIGLYSFPTVHQLISTISCELKPSCTFSDIIQATFPMGSMTGAPKKAAVQFSEETEQFTRGLYSGSIGIIYPNGDFDLNVVIRSLIYDVVQNRISCAVGGAITHLSKAEEEYEECKTKVGKILSLFGPTPW